MATAATPTRTAPAGARRRSLVGPQFNRSGRPPSSIAARGTGADPPVCPPDRSGSAVGPVVRRCCPSGATIWPLSPAARRAPAERHCGSRSSPRLARDRAPGCGVDPALAGAADHPGPHGAHRVPTAVPRSLRRGKRGPPRSGCSRTPNRRGDANPLRKRPSSAYARPASRPAPPPTQASDRGGSARQDRRGLASAPRPKA